MQLEAMFNYQKTILNGYVEVSNELSNINNMEQLYNMKSKQVEVLSKSIDITNDLFKSARADKYILMNLRDVFDAKRDLIDAEEATI